MIHPFKFHGRDSEYFGIWIVNVLLNIVTLGLYSPWAHVRNKQYFYGNTELAGERFEYLATGKQIFLGRMLAGGLFTVYMLVQNSLPEVSLGIGLIIFLLMPWIVRRSLSFNARMTRYRGVRFEFLGTVKGAYIQLFFKPILGYLAVLTIFGLGLLALVAIGGGDLRTLFSDGLTKNEYAALVNYKTAVGAVVVFILLFFAVLFVAAWVANGSASYLHNGYVYGSQRFNAQLATREFVRIYGKISLFMGGVILLAVVLISIFVSATMSVLQDSAQNGYGNLFITLGTLLAFIAYVGFFAVMLFARAMMFSRVRRYTFNQTFVGREQAFRLNSSVGTRGYALLLFTNALMVMVSLGLLTPVVKVRLAQFLADHTAVQGDVDALSTQEQLTHKGGSAADALGDVFDLDIQF